MAKSVVRVVPDELDANESVDEMDGLAAVFAEHGYVVAGLRAFDLFPMTHHVECVALLEPAG